MSLIAKQRAWGRCIAIGLLVGVVGCSFHEEPMPYAATPVAREEATPVSQARESVPAATPVTTQTGTASWYGPGFHGKETASGETFDQHDMTAAHPTLPLGTEAKVTNLETGQSVHVEINDRGPYVGDRKIDLSQAAARKIGLIKKGVAKVKIEAQAPDQSKK